MKKTKKADLSAGMLTAYRNRRVGRGMCAIIDGTKVIYYGRIGSAPMPEGKQVHLHPDDYETLKNATKKHQH